MALYGTTYTHTVTKNTVTHYYCVYMLALYLSFLNITNLCVFCPFLILKTESLSSLEFFFLEYFMQVQIYHQVSMSSPCLAGRPHHSPLHCAPWISNPLWTIYHFPHIFGLAFPQYHPIPFCLLLFQLPPFQLSQTQLRRKRSWLSSTQGHF